ncbi:MAG: hypothetical protein AAF891_07620 [Pseudomonadota bacterium]
MTASHPSRGGATVSALSHMEAWESSLILNLRLWCEGPQGQSQIWRDYHRSLPKQQAHEMCAAFETLMRTLIDCAYRPLVRHDVSCACVGSDECVFVNLVRVASDGHLNDAALISTLLAGPAQAEHIAILAGRVGECSRQIHEQISEFSSALPKNVVRLH